MPLLVESSGIFDSIPFCSFFAFPILYLSVPSLYLPVA